mmetsp:Transcript_26645/g.37547  ORF Transcript_26645/g.37547 Transcript_26645/m.37547 type:complete len:305 (+) Transcript_26645:163-1077(+)
MCSNNCYPNSPLLIPVQLLTFAAWLSSMVAFLTCSFVTIEMSSDKEESIFSDSTLKLGLFRREVDYVYNQFGDDNNYDDLFFDNDSELFLKDCQPYSRDQRDQWWDAPWKIAYAMTVIAFSLGFVLHIISLVLSCVSAERPMLQFFGGSCILMSTMEFFSLLVFSADLCQLRTDAGRFGDCEMSTGSRAAVASGLMWFFAGIILCVLPGPKSPGNQTSYAAGTTTQVQGATPGRVAQASTVTTTESILADGSRKTVKTTVHPDGSRTVEETIIHANPEMGVATAPSTEEMPSKTNIPLASATAY